MRILVVTHNYPRFRGDPAGAFVARLGHEVARSGHEVCVVAPHASGAPVSEHHDSVSVLRFRYAPAPLERVGYRGDLHRRPVLTPLVSLGVPAFLVAFYAAVRHAVRSFHPDVIHAHWWIPAGWLVARQRVPYVVTCHGSDVRLLDRSTFLRRLAAGVFRRAAAVTTVSEFLAENIRTLFPTVSARVHVAPMPIDVDVFSRGLVTPKADPPRILYAGNLIPTKGVSDLITALSLLIGRGVRCRLKIVGEGPSLGALRDMARELGVADYVEWSPFVTQDAMPAEYGASTVTVLPTRGQEEGLGLMLVEAVLAGAAVVGTRAGGIPEVVIDGQTGLLARGGDPADLALKIGLLLTDAPLRARLTLRGRERVRDVYAASNAASRFLALYCGVVDRSSAA